MPLKKHILQRRRLQTRAPPPALQEPLIDGSNADRPGGAQVRFRAGVTFALLVPVCFAGCASEYFAVPADLSSLVLPMRPGVCLPIIPSKPGSYRILDIPFPVERADRHYPEISFSILASGDIDFSKATESRALEHQITISLRGYDTSMVELCRRASLYSENDRSWDAIDEYNKFMRTPLRAVAARRGSR